MAATGERADPYGQYNFTLSIDSTNIAGFTECTGLDAEIQRIDYREGADTRQNPRKLRGMVTYTDITLRRGYTQDRDLWDWYNKILSGTMDRRSIDITLLNEARQEVLMWTISDAWICAWKGPALNATTNEVAIEEVIICHEGLQLADPSGQ